MTLNTSPRRGAAAGRLRWLTLLAAWGCAMGAQAAPASSYRFVDLQVNSCCHLSSAATAINNAGQVLGGGSSPEGIITGLIWTETTEHWTGGSGRYNTALAFNDRGEGVGYGSYGWTNQANYWNASSSVVLDSAFPHPDGPSQAASINNAGQIVGQGLAADGNQQAMLWQTPHSKVTVLRGLAGSEISSASAINEAGQVVGDSTFFGSGGFGPRATLWTNGMPTDLGVLHEGDGSGAFDINNAGQVLGVSGDQAVVWTDGAIKALGALNGATSGSATDINNLGQIVGASTIGGQSVATLWDGQEVIDLNQFVDGAKWLLTDAVGINDHGWVAGNAKDLVTGESRPYLLIPTSVPEPGTVTLALLGGGVLLLARRRRVQGMEA